MIAQDQEGRIAGGWHGKVVGCSVEEVEVRTVLEGVRLVVTNKWHNVIFESNAVTVINHLHGRDFAWTIDSILANAVTLSGNID